MRIRLPKTRRFRVYLYILAFALIFLAGDLLLVRIGRHITIGYDTTRITGPLFPDGRPNYIQSLEDQFSAGVTPDNNAAPLLLAATGPKYLPADALADLYKRLSMAPLPEIGDYFVTYEMFLKRRGSLSDKETSLSIDEEDAASSAILAQDISSLGGIQTLADQRRMNMELTRIALALGAYHAERSAYPATLAALAPTYLPAIPDDLFIDKPLHYRTTPGGYLLYAVGPNMIDDHGHNRHKDRADADADDLTVLVGEFPTTRPGS